MSEKLRNENVNESQRDVQRDISLKDVQSPSASSFDQKKEFFEQVLTTKEEVPKEEIKTEQKKDIIEDLQTIGQKQEGKTFEEKKEFFENIDKVEDTSSSPTPSPSQSQQQQEKISPKEVWRNKYEGESQSPIGSETSDLVGTDRSSQQVFDSNKNEKESSSGSNVPFLQQDKDRTTQSQDLSNKSQQGKETSGSGVPFLHQDKDISTQSQDLSWQSNKDQKESSSGSGVSSLQQGKDELPLATESTPKERDTSFGSESSVKKGKDTSTQSQDFGSGVSSFQQGKESISSPSQDFSQLQQGKDRSNQSQDSSWQSNKDQKESFSGSEIPLIQQPGDVSVKSQDLGTHSQQGIKYESEPTVQHDIPFGTESTLKGRDTSFGNESLLQQGKDDTSFGSESSLKGKDDTAFGSFFPKEGQTTQQGDLINFGQQNESEKQGQESSLGSVSSTLPQEISGTGQSKQKKDCCNNEDCSCKVGECDCNDKKDENLKSRIKRKKAFEPKDPSQFTSGPKISENKSN